MADENIDLNEFPLTSLNENDRILFNVNRSEVKKVLPEWFRADNPKLIALLESYYKNLYENNDQLYYDLRNIQKVRDDFLIHLENEFLAGQGYFDGFDDLRMALRYSNVFFRSKGTEQNIVLFFKGFYNEDVIVSYPRDNILITEKSINTENTKTYLDTLVYEKLAIELLQTAVGLTTAEFHEVFIATNPRTGNPYGDINGSGSITSTDALQMLLYSQGVQTNLTYIENIVDILEHPKVVAYYTNNIYESMGTKLGTSYLTNNTKYQTNSIEITTSLDTDIWLDTYRLLIHPAGMYLSVNGQNVNLSETITSDRLAASTTVIGPKIYPIGRSAQRSGYLEVYG